MLRNAEIFREMQRNAEKCKEVLRNAEKFREMQICKDIIITFIHDLYSDKCRENDKVTQSESD